MKRLITRPDFRFIWGVSLACVMLAILSGILWYNTFDRTPPISDMKGEVDSVFKRADGSRLMIVRWTGTRQRHCLGRSERWLIDGLTFGLPTLIHPPREDEKIGAPIDHKVAVEIPSAFPAHHGVYQIRMVYQCNWLQAQYPELLSVVVTPPPVPFDLTGEAK